ncbi:putative twin-arginine translocation pathway signal protein [Burkholderia pseudomallei]|uniref:hypothetical protein n=1 Tax=Burkholderia pseudomallei TaxID=28450 RepID=UPI000F093807|nr:hypothetical protein [Burkholderia pseudomallei]CAJ3148702.1 putative twin-arginine translocation pathway signal protein [Burkholderia pseudomallei]VCN38344.1 putative twin-arginine translocation pathway signal protein [Burkholderia pseudomallei]VCN49679.1 putative twin-arginine translocation pathway signal protein [Burkholderia pseudomallei]VCN64734.1 putative twin-arginine translocation pathway signal protein [Burkholderia pseudomallei]VCN69668.1 putative twin-arginine translocation pathw
MSARRWTVALAAAATATALCLSVLAGWQRGGTLPERAVWVATGVVLVVSAHLLPALIRDTPLHVRLMGGTLWAACLATACYGHAVFFVFAQQHAGEQRVATVAVAPVTTPHRSLTAVVADRAAVVRQLAWADAQRCSRDCTARVTRHATLAARLEALDAEAGDVRRSQAEDDRAVAQRDALLADPVTSRLAALLGTTAARVDLLSGLAFAVVLEGIACLLWWLALSPPLRPAPLPGVVAAVAPVTSVTDAMSPAVTAVADSHFGVTVSTETVPESRAEGAANHDAVTHSRDHSVANAAVSGDDVNRLADDIAAGRLRPTVADIRRHLGCSQSRAIALRRHLAALTPAA